MSRHITAVESEFLQQGASGLALRRGLKRDAALEAISERRRAISDALRELRTSPSQRMLQRLTGCRDVSYLLLAVQRCASFGDSTGLLLKASRDPRAFGAIKSHCIPFDTRGAMPVFPLAPKMQRLDTRSRLLTWRDVAATGLEHSDKSLSAQHRWIQKHCVAAPPPGPAPAPAAPGPAPAPPPEEITMIADSWEDL